MPKLTTTKCKLQTKQFIRTEFTFTSMMLYKQKYVLISMRIKTQSLNKTKDGILCHLRVSYRNMHANKIGSASARMEAVACAAPPPSTTGALPFLGSATPPAGAAGGGRRHLIFSQ